MPLFLLVTACMGLNTTAPQSAMPIGEPSEPPFGYKEFCKRSPEECAVPYSAEFGKALQKAHHHTKTLLIPVEEEQEYWQVLETVSEGDCEDFALTLRASLRREFPGYEAAFLMATAYTEGDVYHAVLSIETTQGTIVCDNRFPQCAPWESFPYRWKLREVSGSPKWENLTTALADHNVATAHSRKRRAPAS